MRADPMNAVTKGRAQGGNPPGGGGKDSESPSDWEACPKCKAVHRARLHNGAKQCQAHSKRTGKQCGRAADLEQGRVCKHHGGASPKGAASPAFVDGRYSKYLPAPLGESFERLMADPDLISLRGDIALTGTRIETLLARIETGEVGSAMRAIEGHAATALEALEAGNNGSLKEALDKMSEAVKELKKGDGVWREIAQWQNHRRRLTDTERRRLEALHLYVNEERMMTLVASFIALIRECVHDKATLVKLIHGIQRIAIGGQHGKDRLAGKAEVMVHAG